MQPKKNHHEKETRKEKEKILALAPHLETTKQKLFTSVVDFVPGREEEKSKSIEVNAKRKGAKEREKKSS